MISEQAYATALVDLDLGPLSVIVEDVSPSTGADLLLLLDWDGDPSPFVAECKNARDLRSLQRAIDQARASAKLTRRYPVVIVPYLNDDWLVHLRSQQMSGIDLAGNVWATVPGRWSCWQRGFPNRYPRARPSRMPLRGKSALVGRILLTCSSFESIGAVQAAIEDRGGSISLAQVSKVLSALEANLMIRKEAAGVRLIQPDRLLDALTNAYRLPEPVDEARFKAPMGSDLFAHLLRAAAKRNAGIVGYQPSRYVIAPESTEQLQVYVEPNGFGPLTQLPELDSSPRFANLTVQAIDDPGVFFDATEEDGFRWCSPLETYLQLMQGGKREQEVAAPLRRDILKRADLRP